MHIRNHVLMNSNNTTGAHVGTQPVLVWHGKGGGSRAAAFLVMRQSSADQVTAERDHGGEQSALREPAGN